MAPGVNTADHGREAKEIDGGHVSLELEQPVLLSRPEAAWAASALGAVMTSHCLPGSGREQARPPPDPAAAEAQRRRVGTSAARTFVTGCQEPTNKQKPPSGSGQPSVGTRGAGPESQSGSEQRACFSRFPTLQSVLPAASPPFHVVGPWWAVRDSLQSSRSRCQFPGAGHREAPQGDLHTIL